MQTFLPDPDFAVTARILDGRRLGKQRVEAMQILRALTRERYGWKSHPAVLMWAGLEEALAAYALAMCAEWCGRGCADTVAASVVADLQEATGIEEPRSQAELAAAGALPPWLGDEAFHASHPVGPRAQGPRALPAAVPRRGGRPGLRVACAVAGCRCTRRRSRPEPVGPSLR